MSVWRRYLVKDFSGRLVDLPSRLLDRADDGTAPLPAYAGRCVEMVAAVLVGDRGAPPRVAEMEFTKLYFDQSGYVDAAKRERMIRLMLESCADRRGRPSGRPSDGDRAEGDRSRAGAARDQLMREFGWDPKPSERDAVLSRLDPARLDGASPAGGRTFH
ncbi:hypothetical protein [Azospirillum doebereinerae]|uniref:Uncharacterized protein n=1 Tax=Azospirillum doebereinerae TaxID=92933 RepID=A0A433J2S8_9PROT|nr:hypothetical protein [Azospirillum doebereinerae]MCG5242478.1 hypothetical protein [Azospirillum doebereinerae]RUQ66000.1 hypothetical protein EJ913_24470 [Azospirillum doebereinerae]